MLVIAKVMVEQVDERLDKTDKVVHMGQQVLVEHKLDIEVQVIKVLINLIEVMVQVHTDKVDEVDGDEVIQV